MITTRGTPNRSSSGLNGRPSRGCTPSVANRVPEQAQAPTRSGSAPAVSAPTVVVRVVYALIDWNVVDADCQSKKFPGASAMSCSSPTTFRSNSTTSRSGRSYGSGRSR
jgi:hypothetical protein